MSLCRKFKLRLVSLVFLSFVIPAFSVIPASPDVIPAPAAVQPQLPAPSTATSQPLLLTTQNYLPEVLALFQNAQTSIHASLYLVNLTSQVPQASAQDPVFSLLQALARAQGRGVAVTVALEGTGFILQDNLPALQYLRSQGVTAYFDSPGIVNHEKVIVVDRRWVIIGSTNWTRAALIYNREKSLLLENPALAEELLAQFPPQEAPGVKIPFSLLQNPQFQALLTHQGYNQFDLYLLLLKDASPQGGLTADYASLAPRIAGFTPQDKTSNFWTLLRLLADKNLIEFDPASGKVTIPGYPPRDEFFQLPFAYWDCGYDRSLSQAAKYLYLISLAETAQSLYYPRWFRSKDDLAEKYGIGRVTVTSGLLELEKANLQEVIRDLYLEDQLRQANRYYLNELLSDEVKSRLWQDLAGRYGAARVGQARQYAELLNEPNDPKAAARIITLEDEYGAERVKKVFDKVRTYGLDSGRRNLYYVIWLVKNWQ